MLLHSFFLWVSTGTHISSVVDRLIRCWIVIRQCPSYSITLWVLPMIHNAFGKLYPPLDQPCSAFELVFLLLKLVVYVTKKPDGLNLYLPLIRENPKVFTSHTLLVLYQLKFQHYNFIKARGEWNDMHWRSGSRPWTFVHAHGNDVDRLGSFLQKDFSPK